MSVIDLLFPQAELEALGNKWHEPAPKRRKLDLVAASEREQEHRRDRAVALAAPAVERHRRFTTAYYPQPRRLSSKSHFSTVRRSNSDSQPTAVAAAAAASRDVQSQSTPTSTGSTATSTSVARSFLPSFIEPSILQNYLQHLHPNDRPRYSLPSSPRPEPGSHLQEESRPIPSQQQHDEDSEPSPGALTADTWSPAPSSDSFPAPSTGIFEQLHCGPFSHLIQGLRITEHERDMVKDLLNPDGPMQLLPDEFRSTKPKVESDQADALDDFYRVDEGFLHKIHPLVHERPALDKEGVKGTLVFHEDKEQDIYSSGLSPAVEEAREADKKSPAGIIMYDYSTLSDDEDEDGDDELFDYEKAAGPPLATP